MNGPPYAEGRRATRDHRPPRRGAVSSEITEERSDRIEWICPECQRTGEELDTTDRCPDCNERLREVIPDGGEGENGIEHSTCGTVGCQREPVVIYRYAPHTVKVDYEETRLCLPCRRVVAFSSGIPWGDTNEEWHDRHAFRDFDEENTVVKKSRKYDDADG